QETVNPILRRVVRIRASDAKFSVVWVGSAAKAAVVILTCPKRMLHPPLADLLQAVVISRSAAHPIEILANNRMRYARELHKIHGLVSVVARGRRNAQTDLASTTSDLDHAGHVSHDDIGPRHRTVWTI